MQIIVNADDFGWNESCSKAIIDSFSKQLITTTTACVNGEYFDEAVELIKKTEYVRNIGIHFNLTEGKPLTQEMRESRAFCGVDDLYINSFSRNSILTSDMKRLVYNELLAQIEKFRKSGLKIHHVDSHHHIHNAPGIFPIVAEIMRSERLDQIRKLRNTGNISLIKGIYKNLLNRYIDYQKWGYSDYFGSYQDYLQTLDRDCVFEMMTHPDYQDELLVDRDPDSTYEKPYGVRMEDIRCEIEKRRHIIAQY